MGRRRKPGQPSVVVTRGLDDIPSRCTPGRMSASLSRPDQDGGQRGQSMVWCTDRVAWSGIHLATHGSRSSRTLFSPRIPAERAQAQAEQSESCRDRHFRHNINTRIAGKSQRIGAGWEIFKGEGR